MKWIFVLFTITIYMFKTLVIYDFNINDKLNSWYIINDGVMGGLSKGNFKITKEGHGAFYGFVSLENNGGFSLVRYDCKTINSESYTKLKLRVKGDGKTYQVRIKKNKTDYFSYISYFSTTTEWETITIKLDELYPYFRGKKLNAPNFDGLQIDQIGILIGNSKNEQFSLLIDKIELE